MLAKPVTDKIVDEELPIIPSLLVIDIAIGALLDITNTLTGKAIGEAKVPTMANLLVI